MDIKKLRVVAIAVVVVVVVIVVVYSAVQKMAKEKCSRAIATAWRGGCIAKGNARAFSLYVFMKLDTILERIILLIATKKPTID